MGDVDNKGDKTPGVDDVTNPTDDHTEHMGQEPEGKDTWDGSPIPAHVQRLFDVQYRSMLERIYDEVFPAQYRDKETALEYLHQLLYNNLIPACNSSALSYNNVYVGNARAIRSDGKSNPRLKKPGMTNHYATVEYAYPGINIRTSVITFAANGDFNPRKSSGPSANYLKSYMELSMPQSTFSMIISSISNASGLAGVKAPSGASDSETGEYKRIIVKLTPQSMATVVTGSVEPCPPYQLGSSNPGMYKCLFTCTIGVNIEVADGVRLTDELKTTLPGRLSMRVSEIFVVAESDPSVTSRNNPETHGVNKYRSTRIRG